MADEESFLPGDALDPGFPAGDASILGLGAGWRGRRFAVDAGLSLPDVDDRQRELPRERFATDRTELATSLRFAL